MSEVLEEVDKGLIPTITSLESQLGDTTGAVERTYEAGKTWRDTIRETKDAALAYIGPAGDVLGVVGSTVTALALAGPQMLTWIKATKLATVAQKAFNLVIRLNPIGLIVTAITLVGLAIYKWRDQIWSFLKGAWNALVKGLEEGYNFIARIVPGLDEVSFASKHSFAPAVEEAAVSVEHLVAAAEPVPPKLNQVTSSFTQLVDTLRGAGAITSALEAAAAIKAVGGVTQLTEADLKRLNGTLETAMGYYRATGRVAPEELHRAYVATADLLRQTKELIDSGLKPLPAALQSTSIELDLMMGVHIPRVTSAFRNSFQRSTGFATKFLEDVSKILSPSAMTNVFTTGFTGGGGVMGALKAIGAQLAGALSKAFLSPLSSALSSGVSRIMGSLGLGGAAAAAGSAGAGSAGAAAGGIGISAGTLGIGAAVIGGGLLLKKLFGKSEETKKVSPRRDKFFAQFGGYQGLATGLTEALQSGSRASGLIKRLYDADTLSKYQRAQGVIVSAFSAAGRQVKAFAEGGIVRRPTVGILGERGPEAVVTPSQLRRFAGVEGMSAEDIGEAVARALQRSPLVVPQDPVTDALYRNGPRRAALKGYA